MDGIEGVVRVAEICGVTVKRRYWLDISGPGAVDDVHDGLTSCMETKVRAEELEARVKWTDELIGDIVYELSGLTDEEIKIVEEPVGGWVFLLSSKAPIQT